MRKEFEHWAKEVGGPGWKWYAKILSGNDTLLNKAHQAGPYVPKQIVFDLFPSIARSTELNPRKAIHVAIDSHGAEADATAIWYNNKILEKGTRNEARITNWGGKQSPVLDPEATGSLVVLAFWRPGSDDASQCRVWLTTGWEEQEYFEDLVGPIEPGVAFYFDASSPLLNIAAPAVQDLPCWMNAEQIPVEWRLAFPEAADIVARSIQNLPKARQLPPDDRLLRRRDCEFEVFRSLEDAIVLPRIKEGFATVDVFVAFANSVTNRRKSRSGASLELQSKTVFDEEGLAHSHDEVSEDRKRPDFLFPSVEAYRDTGFAADKLRMLGVKTTCKDRWRQILNEADRVPRKHLLTLQEGISPNQLEEMTTAGVTLVVPRGLHSTYTDEARAHIIAFEDFISETKRVCS